ncbi:hypothetical protein ONE63_005680 [Megalurothrips usitatus]|uniref:Promethin n=1 Tax=Megalurothrips usitatus TaxID=439358 RepID=A0AAV7Y3J9_9NEOP|nr:hypothetical protein ONE63_005680 [Megalurothrips usitatus]
MVECNDMESPQKIADTPDSQDEHLVLKQSHNSREYEESTRNNATHDNVELLTRYYHFGLRWIRRSFRVVSHLLVELHVPELLKELKILISSHPLAATIVAIIVVACGIPILIFLAFAIATLIFTFGGFLIIEGAVLAAASFALIICLSSMAVAFITLGCVSGLLYFTYMQIDRVMRANGWYGENLQPYEARLPEILASIRSSNWHHKGRGSLSSHSSNNHTHKHHSK